MELGLEGHVVLVVGGASGIGRATVAGFLDEGACVVVWDQQSTVTEIAQPSDQCVGLQVDITDETAVKEAADRSAEFFGQPMHLVHAAAVGSGCFGFPFTSLQPSDWRKVIDVNIIGLTNVTHALAPQLIASGDGSICVVASVAGQIGSPTDPPYSASKAANINFMQVMAHDLAPQGIRVNAVCPGMVKTPLNKSVWRSWNDRQPEDRKQSYDQWAAEKIRQLVPLGRWQTPENVADMIVFLASDRASEVTGQTINVDGGYVMHW